MKDSGATYARHGGERRGRDRAAEGSQDPGRQHGEGVGLLAAVLRQGPRVERERGRHRRPVRVDRRSSRSRRPRPTRCRANFLKYIGKDKADGFSLQAYASGLFLRDVVNNVIKAAGTTRSPGRRCSKAAPTITDVQRRRHARRHQRRPARTEPVLRARCRSRAASSCGCSPPRRARSTATRRTSTRSSWTCS